LNSESLGIHGGRGSHFDDVRRWGDNLPLPYRDVPRRVPPTPRVLLSRTGQARGTDILREHLESRLGPVRISRSDFLILRSANHAPSLYRRPLWALSGDAATTYISLLFLDVYVVLWLCEWRSHRF
jgi:hypothetical protein